MLLRRLALASLLLTPLLSTSCETLGLKAAEPPTVITDIQKAEPIVPAVLLTCAPEPEVPADATDMEGRAKSIVALAMAGRDCREKLGEVRNLLNRRH